MTASGRDVSGLALSSVTLFSLLAVGGCRSGDSNAAPAGSADPAAGNRPPVISGNPAASVKVGHRYDFTPTASDPDGDALTFSIEAKPDWAGFDGATGTLSGSPQVGDEGPYEGIAIAASDGTARDTLTFSIEVTQTAENSLTLSWQAPTTNTNGSPLTDLAGYKIYYGVAPGDYTEEIRIDNPGIATYLVENLSPNTWYFVFTAFNTANLESDFSEVAEATMD